MSNPAQAFWVRTAVTKASSRFLIISMVISFLSSMGYVAYSHTASVELYGTMRCKCFIMPCNGGIENSAAL